MWGGGCGAAVWLALCVKSSLGARKDTKAAFPFPVPGTPGAPRAPLLPGGDVQGEGSGGLEG